MNLLNNVLFDFDVDNSETLFYTNQDILNLFGSTFFNSSYCLTAELIHFCKEFEDEQYQLISNYFCSQFRPSHISTEPSASLLNLMVDIYIRQHNQESFPTLQEIIDEMFMYRCTCLYFLPENDIRLLLQDYVLQKCDIPKCSDCHLLIHYYILHKQLPSDQELVEFITRIYNFNQNPDEFYQQDKIKVPTLYIDQLPISTITSNDIQQDRCCPLCQNDFELNQTTITLLPCKHIFHHKNEDCLDNSNIITWLKENNYCPLCKSHIHI